MRGAQVGGHGQGIVKYGEVGGRMVGARGEDGVGKHGDLGALRVGRGGPREGVVDEADRVAIITL